MSHQKTNIQEEIKRAERKLEILRDIDILDSEFRLIKNEYLQRRQELCGRLNVDERLLPEHLEAV